MCISNVVRDNPTAIVSPLNISDPGYILAESDGGLGNRLRVLAAYMYIGKFKFDGAHLVFIWDVNQACPGHYLEIFDPLRDVIFATNNSRYVLDKHAKIVYENSLAVFQWTMQMNNIPKRRYGLPTWWQVEYNMFSEFVPTQRVLEKVYDFTEKYNVCNISSMHIRLTDLNAIMPPRKKVSLNGFYSFVESQIDPVYLMTDDPGTQEHFLNKYGRDKIIVYDQVGKGLINKTDIPLITLPIRYTTLEHTLIDVLIAAHAKKFHPSSFSSMSDLVQMFSRIGRDKYSWCSPKVFNR